MSLAKSSGVPGRVTMKRGGGAGHYDINHTDIPDPVVRALECLAAQVTDLESEVRRLKKGSGAGRKGGKRGIRVIEGGKRCLDETVK